MTIIYSYYTLEFGFLKVFIIYDYYIFLKRSLREIPQTRSFVQTNILCFAMRYYTEAKPYITQEKEGSNLVFI